MGSRSTIRSRILVGGNVGDRVEAEACQRNVEPVAAAGHPLDRHDVDVLLQLVERRFTDRRAEEFHQRRAVDGVFDRALGQGGEAGWRWRGRGRCCGRRFAGMLKDVARCGGEDQRKSAGELLGKC